MRPLPRIRMLRVSCGKQGPAVRSILPDAALHERVPGAKPAIKGSLRCDVQEKCCLKHERRGHQLESRSACGECGPRCSRDEHGGVEVLLPRRGQQGRLWDRKSQTPYRSWLQAAEPSASSALRGLRGPDRTAISTCSAPRSTRNCGRAATAFSNGRGERD